MLNSIALFLESFGFERYWTCLKSVPNYPPFASCLLPRRAVSMIFERSLQRELVFATLAIFMALLAIMFTAMMIRIVGFAAAGLVDPRDILRLIGLTVLGYLPVILSIALFTSILFVLTRWCRDSEILVWMTCGLSPLRFVKPVAVFSLPLIAAVAFGAFLSSPWSHGQSKQLRERFTQRDEIALLASGQ